jgi:hypothetical protein
MIKEHRHKRILSILKADGVASLADIHALMPEISRVTLRRDLADLAEAGALRRTHGGATLPDAAILRASRPHASRSQYSTDLANSEILQLDAVILPPISGRGSEALRQRIIRSKIPFLAESALRLVESISEDNRSAGLELGQTGWAGNVGRSATSSSSITRNCPIPASVRMALRQACARPIVILSSHPG